MKQTIPELLAPAGSLDALKAAVECGADAVYMGTREFSARRYADNFNTTALLDAIDYAHQRGVAAYITVNTLVKDRELNATIEYLEQLCNHGADAVIVQDLGILNIIHEHLPELPIHASTQMTIHNSAGVRLLEALGIKRAVLARELTLEELKSIRASTSIQLEVFVHGALCISYSGRCLMSSFIGGRSGNRGYCAQPCRKKYSLIGEKRDGEYLLSPKDLNLSYHLNDLIQAGVDSFKIEGRMKKPEYVAVVTKTYRDLLDRLSDNPDTIITPPQLHDLGIIFNRGFTEGYLHGDPGRHLMSMKMPGNRGIRLGRVIRYHQQRGSVSVKLETPLHVGDGITVGKIGTSITMLWIDGKQVENAPAGSIVSFPLKSPVAAGSIVYRTFDSVLVESVRKTYQSVNRRIHVSVEVEARKGYPLLIRMGDGQGNVAEAISDTEIPSARQRPLDRQSLIKQVSKLGGTIFEAKKVHIQMDDDVFIPIGVINSVRRKAAERLARVRADGYRRRCGSIVLDKTDTAEKIKQPEIKLSIRVTEPEAVNAAVSSGADRVYVDFEGIIQKESLTNRVIEKAHKADATVFVRLPDIAKDAEMDIMTDTLNNLYGLDGILAAGIDQIYLLKNIFDISLAVDYPVNAFNQETLDFLSEMGISSITISPELTLDEIADISANREIECLVQGAVQLMVSEHCLIGGIKRCTRPKSINKSTDVNGSTYIHRPCEISCVIRDEKGFLFPVRFDNMCRTHIYNSRELCIIDRIPDILDAGVSSLRIEGINYNIEEVKQITMLYRLAIDSYLEKPAEFDGKSYLFKLKEVFPQGLTTGHYFRGVQ